MLASTPLKLASMSTLYCAMFPSFLETTDGVEVGRLVGLLAYSGCVGSAGSQLGIAYCGLGGRMGDGSGPVYSAEVDGSCARRPCCWKACIAIVSIHMP